MLLGKQALIRSVKEKCKVCYTCVRKCPAKAIRIEQGQATLIPERCIGCGNCVRVCSQKAKEVVFDAGKVYDLLALKAGTKIAIIAPSFPVEFDEVGDYKVFVGMVKKMGFAHIHEVAFGADLVANAYQKLLNDHPDKKYIASTCPAVVNYIQYYTPQLVPNLAPIVSPMVATVRVLRIIYKNAKIVFIGPCFAKKAETYDLGPEDALDCVLTFAELRQLFVEMGIIPESAEPANFDPPYPRRGVLFPLSRGLLDTAGLKKDLLAGDIIVADGQTNFITAIREFEKRGMNARLAEILCCKGCIMGAGITKTEKPLFERRACVSDYAQQRMRETSGSFNLWEFQELDLSRAFVAKDRRMPNATEEQIQHILETMGKFAKEDELNCGACGYDTCRDHAKAVVNGLAESKMCLPYAIEQLKLTVQLTEKARQLEEEKRRVRFDFITVLAHELKSPINAIEGYADIITGREVGPALESYDSMIQRIKLRTGAMRKLIVDLLDLTRIESGGYARKLERLDIGELAAAVIENCRELATQKKVEVHFQSSEGHFYQADRMEMEMVLTNFITNGIKYNRENGTVNIMIQSDAHNLTLTFVDTGIGMNEEEQKYLFKEFCRIKNKKTQGIEGSGLGLSIVHKIVSLYGGNIHIQSQRDVGSTFQVVLPK
jgi:signal transduction histidine kinase/iron only hydrogenase large subunit-like protein